MGQTMFKGRYHDSEEWIPLSDRPKDDDSNVLFYLQHSFISRLYRFCLRLIFRKPPPDPTPLYPPPFNFREVENEIRKERLANFRTPKPSPDLTPDLRLPPNFRAYNVPQHCVVQIQEPFLAKPMIGLQRAVVVEQKRPPSLPLQVPRPPQPVLATVVVVEQKRPPPLRSSTASIKKKKASLGPYSSEQRILVVGDGDFSFSASLAVAFGDASNIVATSLDSYEFLMRNYGKAATNIKALTSRSSKVIHRVDATKMARHPKLCSFKFDRIVYNFPHAGFANRNASRQLQIRENQALVKGFLENAKKMIKEEDGQIHISHKCRGFYLDWNLAKLGANLGLRLVEESHFDYQVYPGYATKYGFGGDANFNCYPSKSYKFQLSI